MYRFVPLSFCLYLGHLLRIDFNPVNLDYLVIILLLILSFRLMDDLFDLPSDRIEFPERVLCRTKELRPFILLLFVLYLLLFAFMIVERKIISLCILLTAIWFFCLWYAKIRFFFDSKTLHSLVVLTKYPLFLYILAPMIVRSAIPVLLYATFLLFEWQDDPELKASAAAVRIRAISLLVYLGMFSTLLGLSSESPVGWVVLVFCLALQLTMFIQNNCFAAYIPFFNTFLLFGLLSYNYLLL